jgi:muconolactone D-isomerase
MEFMVRIDVVLPPDLPDAELEALKAAELARGRELVAAGTLKAIWRIPGGLRNIGVWKAADATALHAAIESLPVYRWLSAEVTPLAEHPLGRIG